LWMSMGEFVEAVYEEYKHLSIRVSAVKFELDVLS
jgi:hypothetical protein